MKYTYDTYKEMPDGVDDVRLKTTTDVDELSYLDVTTKYYVNVYDNFENRCVAKLSNKEDLEDFKLGVQTGEERAHAWKPKIKEGMMDEKPKTLQDVENEMMEEGSELLMNTTGERSDSLSPYRSASLSPHPHGQKEDPVNPSHYQNYLDKLQWIEAMQRIPSFSYENFNAALELQVRKYMDRCGQKDHSLQEMQKALWYLKLLVARMVAGEPVNVKDVDEILEYHERQL